MSMGLAFVLLACVAAPVAAQPRSSFRGIIADSATYQPVRRAAILLGSDRSASMRRGENTRQTQFLLSGGASSRSIGLRAALPRALIHSLRLNVGVDMTGLLSRCEEGRVAWGSIDGESC